MSACRKATVSHPAVFLRSADSNKAMESPSFTEGEDVKLTGMQILSNTCMPLTIGQPRMYAQISIANSPLQTLTKCLMISETSQENRKQIEYI